MKYSTYKNKNLLFALLTTLLSIGIFGYLTQHHYALKFGMLEGQSLCNVNQVFNCDAVSASQYSSLFGAPIALWGLATNAVMAYFLLITYYNLTENNEKTSRYTFLLSLTTVIASIIMGIISVVFLNNFCLFCMATYALSVAGFIGILRGVQKFTPQQILTDIGDILKTEKWVLGFLIAIPVITFIGNAVFLDSSGFSEIDRIAAEKVLAWKASPTKEFNLAHGISLQGNNEPKLTLIEFADFRCPHCKHAAPSLHAFTQSHPDVRLIFKPFPLDGTCNEAIQGGGDGISCGLASSVMCAEKLANKGWLAHDYFFENQARIAGDHDLEKNIKEISEKLQISLEALNTCVNSSETKELIRSMAKEGQTAEIQGTPTIFANGKLLNGGQLIPILEAVYSSLK